MFAGFGFLKKEDVLVFKETWSNPIPLFLLASFGFLIWSIDSVIEYLFYSQLSFKGVFLTSISPYSFYRRITLIVIFVVFSFVLSLVYQSKMRSERREEFFDSLLTHDLRNKCQVILGNLKLLKNSDEYDNSKLINKSIKSTKELLEVTENVRTWVKSIKNRENCKLSVGEVESIIKGVFDRKKSDFDKDVDVCYEISVEKDEEVFVPPLFSDIIEEFINNCFEKPSCSEIKCVIENNDLLNICLCSDGGVVPEDKRNELFELSYSEEGKSKLGLFFVKKIVEEHGGRIEIHDSSDRGIRLNIKLRKTKELKQSIN